LLEQPPKIIKKKEVAVKVENISKRLMSSSEAVGGVVARGSED
jgi:hypothetical protein